MIATPTAPVIIARAAPHPLYAGVYAVAALIRGRWHYRSAYDAWTTDPDEVRQYETLELAASAATNYHGRV